MRVFKTFAIFLMATGLAALVSAQAIKGSTGNIYGKVTDETGGVLPGVTVTLMGVGAPQTTTTGSQGEFRFLSLSPATYTVKADLSGFATMERTNVVVDIGTNTELTIPMKIAAVATTITVSSATPLLDTRKERTGTNFSQEELKSIPSSRDPWGILQQTASVQMDQVQTGSQASGQQSVFIGKGTNFNNNAWNVDGVAFTDIAAVGASPSYWDFDSFQEMQMSTGGSDPSIQAPGVTLNMVTKRGTNEPHGSARVFDTPGETEAHNTPKEAIEQGVGANSVSSIKEYGAEVGGPVWPDKAWLWGSFGHSDINLITSGGTFDRTQLENYTIKANVQPIESNSATFFYFYGNKTKQGRSAGSTRPQETSWDQKGGAPIWKVDDSQVFGPNLVASASWSYSNTPFSLTPEGGLCVDMFKDANKVYHRSFQFSGNYRPQHQIQGTASAFFNTGSIGHELKFGAAYIHFITKTQSFNPGTGNWGDEKLSSGGPTANITRGLLSAQELKNFGGYIGDTITASNLTVNVGVRYDNQKGANLPSQVAANPVFPEILGQEAYLGGPTNVNTKDWQPRIGITYALGPQHKTLLRASYSRFVDQLGASPTFFDNPAGFIADAKYNWNDANHNHTVDPGELGAFQSANFNTADPNNPVSFSTVDPNLKAPKTDEFLAGFDQELLPNLVAGVTYTYRKRSDFLYKPYKQLNSSSYIRCGSDPVFEAANGLCNASDSNIDPVTGTAQGFDINGNFLGTTGPVYYAPDSLLDSFTAGQTLTNRKDYQEDYNGVELQLTKRLSERWMAHVSAGWNSWKQKVGNIAKSCIDPSNQASLLQPSDLSYTYAGNTCANDIGFDYNGVSIIGSTWQFNVAGLYQLPWNFNISANLFGRQGAPQPFSVDVSPGDGLGDRFMAVGKADDHRLKNIYELDLRLEKVVPLFQKADITLSMDVFNVFNSNTIIHRFLDATPSGSPATGADANFISRFQIPRLLRFGARVSF